ncbi:hypothetical protein CVT24_009876 [Panaeolus cyanescens]|uniref:MYND-type domain-containing protein n=1 Tax=Panaeolus cyanescens TaxID=181874 RepID=A0A409VXV7_9AGAR|nr:hypothetical protein CVT24_009876 [Panaeolus cyanescens]
MEHWQAVFPQWTRGHYSMCYAFTALEDLDNPRFCWGSAVAALATLESDSNISHPIAQEWRMNRKFHKVLYRFLIAKRPQVRPVLITRINRQSSCVECESSPHSIEQEFHRKWNELKDSITPSDYDWFCSQVTLEDQSDLPSVSFWTLLSRIIRILSESLQAHSFKAITQRRSTGWPTKLSQLVPIEPLQVVEGIMQWFHIYARPEILRCLILVAGLVRYPIYGALRRQSIAATIMDSTKHVLDLTMTMMTSTENRSSQSELRWLYDTFVSCVNTLFDFTRLVLASYHPGETKSILMDGNQNKAVQLLSLISYVYPVLNYTVNNQTDSGDEEEIGHDDELDQYGVPVDVKRRACTLGCRVYRTFNIQDTIGPARPAVPYAVGIANYDKKFFFGPSTGFEAELGLSFVWGNSLDYGCFNRFCSTKWTLEGIGRKLMVCGGCSGAHYCGMACQIKDWHDKRHPHKKICAPFSKIVFHRQSQFIRLPDPDSDKVTLTVLQDSAKKRTDLETVQSIREIFRDAQLDICEKEILKEWGRSIYRSVPVRDLSWSPGFDDYTDILAVLEDQAGPFRVTPGNVSILKFATLD